MHLRILVFIKRLPDHLFFDLQSTFSRRHKMCRSQVHCTSQVFHILWKLSEKILRPLLFLQSNLTHLHRSEYVPGVGNGIAKCPYDPNDNSTAVWVEHGNPGELPALYSGTNAEFTKADAIIFRTDLHNLTTGRKEFSYKRTLKYDSKWLDSKYKQVPDTNNGLADSVFGSKRKTDQVLAHMIGVTGN